MKLFILCARILLLTSIAIAFFSATVSSQHHHEVINEVISFADEQAFLLILTPQEKRQYEGIMSLQERRDWREAYWRRHDPTPTTERNEWKEEFQRRVKYAREKYPSTNFLGFDIRGEIYVKYGEPDDKEIDPGGFHEFPETVLRAKRVYYMESRPYLTRPNESWSYDSIYPGLSFDFVKIGGAYKIVDDLTDASVSRKRTEKLRVAQILYRERIHLGSFYASLGLSALDIDEFKRDIRVIAGRRRISQIIAPSNNFFYDYKAAPLDFNFQLARFRGEEGKTRLELYYGVPAEKLKFKEATTGRLISSLELAVVFLDSAYQKVRDESWQIRLAVRDEAHAKTYYGVDQSNFDLPPGLYRFAIRMQNPESNGLGIYRKDVTIDDFSGQALKLSDIQLSLNIREATKAGKFVKHGLRITPYPYSIIRKDRPIFLYYEIYNLKKSPSGQTFYQVEHTANVIKEKKSIVSKIGSIFRGSKRTLISTSYKRKGTEPTAIEYISFDLSRLPRGTVELTVKVKDLNSSEEVQQSNTYLLQ